VFITSSYFRMFLRRSKFSSSICRWALSTARVTIRAAMGSSSGHFSRSMIDDTRSEANIRIRSSSSER